MIRFLWPFVRRVVRLRRGRMPPARLSDPLWYFAFGGNMNEQIFRERRHMTPVESCVGRLPDYRLVFTQAGGMQPGKSAPANIVNAPGNAVYGVLYLLPCEISPDSTIAKASNTTTCGWMLLTMPASGLEP